MTMEYFFRYEILNYQPIQQIGNKTIYDYVTIGQWMSGNIQLNEQSIFWPNRGKNVLGQFRSVCSEPCRSGFVKVRLSLKSFFIINTTYICKT